MRWGILERKDCFASSFFSITEDGAVGAEKKSSSSHWVSFPVASGSDACEWESVVEEFNLTEKVSERNVDKQLIKGLYKQINHLKYHSSSYLA